MEFGKSTRSGRRYNHSTSSVEELDTESSHSMQLDDEEEEPEILFMSQAQGYVQGAPMTGTGSQQQQHSHQRRRRGPRKNERKRAQQMPEGGPEMMNGGYKAAEYEEDTIEIDVDDSTAAEDKNKIDEALDGSSVSGLDSESVMDSQTVTLSDSDEHFSDDDEPVILDDLSQSQDSKHGSTGTSGLGDSSSDDPMLCDPDEVKEITPPDVVKSNEAKKISEERRKNGNMYFARFEYHKALDMYTQAIDALSTEATLYSNRSACYMMLKKYKNAQADARTCVSLDPKFDKGYLRLLRSTLSLGDTLGAEKVLIEINTHIPGVADVSGEIARVKSLKLYLKEIEGAKEKKDFRKILYLTDRALEIADGDLQLKMVKANSLLKLDRFSEALDLCTEVLQTDSMCVEGYYVRAVCFFGQDNLEKSVQFLKQALQFAPDNSICLSLFRQIKKLKEMREEAGKMFSSGQYANAKAKYLECLELLNSIEYTNKTIQSKMYMNLSLISLRMSLEDDALEYVNKALELNPSYLKAHIHRATVHTAKEKFDEAVRDYEAAQKLDPGTSYRKFISDTKASAKRAKRKDYYKILGVSKNANNDEVKKAYKKRALIHHPDRHSSATEFVKKEQEHKFKELGEAYEVLSDQKKRERYDAGHDLLDSDYGGGDHFDPSNLFNVFFQSGGMGMGGGGGGRHSHGGYGGGGGTYFRPGSSNYHPY